MPLLFPSLSTKGAMSRFLKEPMPQFPEYKLAFRAALIGLFCWFLFVAAILSFLGWVVYRLMLHFGVV